MHRARSQSPDFLSRFNSATSDRSARFAFLARTTVSRSECPQARCSSSVRSRASTDLSLRSPFNAPVSRASSCQSSGRNDITTSQSSFICPASPHRASTQHTDRRHAKQVSAHALRSPAVLPGNLACQRGLGPRCLQKARHRRRVEAGAAQVAHAQRVGLELVRARIALHVGTGSEVRDVRDGLVVDDRVDDCRTEAGDEAVAVTLGAVAGGHVADLVGDHACELRLVVGERHQAARDMDVAAGQGEGVDLRAVEDDEGEGRLGLFRGLLEQPAEARDVALQRRVVVEAAERLHQLGMLLGTDPSLFLGREEGGELLVAGRRIDAAPAEQKRRRRGQREAQR